MTTKTKTSPKTKTTKAKAKPTTPAKAVVKPVDGATLAKRLAVAAAREGMWVSDFVRFTDLVTKHKFKVTELTPDVVVQAHGFDRKTVSDLMRKIEKYNQAHAVPVDPVVVPEPVPAPVPAGKPAATIVEPKPTKKPKAEKPATTVTKKARTTIGGLSLTAAVRALAGLGWDINKIRAAMAKAGVDISDTTIRIQFKKAKDQPVKLTAQQKKELLAALK